MSDEVGLNYTSVSYITGVCILPAGLLRSGQIAFGVSVFLGVFVLLLSKYGRSDFKGNSSIFWCFVLIFTVASALSFYNALAYGGINMLSLNDFNRWVKSDWLILILVVTQLSILSLQISKRN
ncbi:MAG: hypothetical protein OIF51_13460 [Cellvibrionaceae bacterium]|nr:hypothetical protein [Cellvibrionaceae bacterium]